MIAFTQFDTLFLSNASDARQFKAGERVFLTRAGSRVSEHPMTVRVSDDSVGFIRMTEQRVCKLAKRGDELRRE